MRSDELIKRAQRGVPGAFESLYYTYADRVHRLLVRVVGPGPDVDDLLQSVFILVHEKLPEYRFESAFSTWLHRITVNAAYELLRKRKREPDWQDPSTLDLLADQEALFAKIAARQEIRQVYSVLAELKPKKRIVFVLYQIEGLSLEEISDIVEARVSTVSERLRAARKEIQRSISKRQRNTKGGERHA